MRDPSGDAHGCGGEVMSRRSMTIFGLSLLFSAVALSRAEDSREILSQEMSKPIIRGGVVYKNYCVLCHGQRGDGMARAARLYKGSKLAITPQSTARYEK